MLVSTARRTHTHYTRQAVNSLCLTRETRLALVAPLWIWLPAVTLYIHNTHTHTPAHTNRDKQTLPWEPLPALSKYKGYSSVSGEATHRNTNSDKGCIVFYILTGKTTHFDSSKNNSKLSISGPHFTEDWPWVGLTVGWLHFNLRNQVRAFLFVCSAEFLLAAGDLLNLASDLSGDNALPIFYILHVWSMNLTVVNLNANLGNEKCIFLREGKWARCIVSRGRIRNQQAVLSFAFLNLY